MKKFTLLFFVAFYCFNSYSQTGVLKGEIIDSNQNPIPYVTVFITSLKKFSSSDLKGIYIVNDLSSGTYSVKVESMGYKTIEKTVLIVANIENTLNFEMPDDVYSLQEVEIIGRTVRSYRPDVTFSATKTAAKIKDIPQSVQVVNKELMQDQQIFRVDEVMKNVSGINNNRDGNTYMARGFEVSMDNLNGNKVSTSDGDPSLVQHLERVEVIKGPASALFGVSSPGGVINAVTKKPLKEDRYEASFTYGSYETKRAGFDGTGSINNNKTFLYRLNVGYENSKSFRDFVVKRNYLIVPSFSIIPNDKIQANVELIYKKVDNTIAKDQGIQIVQNNLWALPIHFNAAEPYDFRKNNEFTFLTSFNYKFSKHLSFNLSSSVREFKQNSLATISTHTFSNDGTQINRRISEGDSKSHSDFITSYFTYKNEFKRFKHEIVAGFDYYNIEKESFARSALGIENGVPLLDFVNRGEPVYNLDRSTIDFQFANGGVPSGFNYWGMYVQDLIEYKKFNVLLGLRFNDYQQTRNGKKQDVDYKTKVLIPRVGLVYKINSLLNIFGSYTQSYQPVSIPLSPTSEDEERIFDPMESFQYETGLKGEFFKKKLVTTLSFYQINRQGRIVVDPTIDAPNDGVNYENLIQLKNEFIRGIELDVSGKLHKNLSMTGNFAYNSIQVKDSRTTVFQEDLENHNPKVSAGFWGKYSFNSKFLNGLGLGFGFNYTSNYTLVDRQIFLGGKPFDFPGIAIADAAIYYKIKAFNFSLNINNVTNKKYFRGVNNLVSLFPGAPRNFLAQISYSF